MKEEEEVTETLDIRGKLFMMLPMLTTRRPALITHITTRQIDTFHPQDKVKVIRKVLVNIYHSIAVPLRMNKRIKLMLTAVKIHTLNKQNC